MCAVDLPDGDTRGEVLRRLYDDEHVLALACGPTSVRFRPALTITDDLVDEALAAFDRVLTAVTGQES
jgi:L-lysine 6-transaminase